MTCKFDTCEFQKDLRIDNGCKSKPEIPDTSAGEETVQRNRAEVKVWVLGQKEIKKSKVLRKSIYI